MNAYSTLVLGLLVLAFAVAAAMLIGRWSRGRARDSEVANDTRHPDAFIMDDADHAVAHSDDVPFEKF